MTAAATYLAIAAVVWWRLHLAERRRAVRAAVAAIPDIVVQLVADTRAFEQAMRDMAVSLAEAADAARRFGAAYAREDTRC